MRRCDRHQTNDYNPYREFSFENSLRKYEISPQKKIKLRSFVQSKSVMVHPLHESVVHNNLLNQQDSASMMVEKSSIERDEDERISIKEDQYMKRDGQEQLRMITPEEHISQGSSEKRSFAEEENIDSDSQAVQIGSQKVQAADNNSQEAPINEKFHSSQKFYTPPVQSSESQRLHLSQSLPSFKSLPSENHEDQSDVIVEQKEGRLNLNGNISVSLRRIKRNKEKGLSEAEMLSEILKKRQYLAEEREEIALKLKHYFSFNS